MVNTVCAINGEIRTGDWVIVKPNDSYGCLAGMVTEINHVGSPEHGTENETDDVHADFVTDTVYSDRRKDEIAAQLSSLYGQEKQFGDLALDDVIMPPDSLIRITGIDLNMMEKILESREAAEIFCNQIENAEKSRYKGE